MAAILDLELPGKQAAPLLETVTHGDRDGDFAFLLEPLGDGAALLTCHGTAPLLVEAARESHNGAVSWELTEVLDQGMTTVLSAGTRFFKEAARSFTTCNVTQHLLPVTPTTHAEHQPLVARSMASANTAGGDSEAHTIDGGPTKRRKVDEVTVVGEAAVDGASPTQSSLPRGAAFHLIRVRSLAPHKDAGYNGIKLNQLVTGKIKLAFVENFMIDLQWLLSACPALENAERFIVVHGEHHGHEDAIHATAANMGLRNFRAHRPPLPIQWGTHHSKAFILAYERGVRVIIHTANLIYVDCNNKSQGVWTQDFPRKTDASPPSSHFQRDLSRYLAALRLPSEARDAMQGICEQHDFSGARVALVPSIPGYHSGPQMTHFGHLRLRHLLKQENIPAHFNDSKVLMQCSSMGSFDENWLLKEFGGSLMAERSQTSNSVGLGYASQITALKNSQLSIIWPTVPEVRSSVEGWVAGYSIPGPAKNVCKPFLPKYYCRWGGEVGGRQRAMPHMKTYARYKGNQLAWYLLASHNLSKAAWGAQQKQGQQLMVRSFELGVLFLPSLESAFRVNPHNAFSCTDMGDESTPSDTVHNVLNAVPDGESAAAGTMLAKENKVDQPAVELWSRAALADEGRAGAGTEAQSSSTLGDAATVCVNLPIPYSLPPQPYAVGDTPWTVDTPYPGLDSLGRPHGVHVNFYDQIEPQD